VLKAGRTGADGAIDEREGARLRQCPRMSPEDTSYDVASTDFHISIVNQGWLESDDPDYDVAVHDLCSHGEIRLLIGGCLIAPGGDEVDYTISTSALALLRTLESDHSPARPVADRLVLHCGMLLMLSCPIGIDWTVLHFDDRVRIVDPIRYDTTDEAEAVRFPGLEVEIPLAEYRSQITAFALGAKQPFEGIEKTFHDDTDRVDYANFWAEYDRLLNQAVRASG
jgi:hypothetical protein